MNHISVTREGEDGLSSQEWLFFVHIGHEVLNLSLDSYREFSRPTKRHKPKVSARYDRLFRRRDEPCLTENEVPLPRDVADEAKDKLVALIRVCTWGERDKA